MSDSERDKINRQREKYTDEKERLKRVKDELEDHHSASRAIYDSLIEMWGTDTLMHQKLLNDFSRFQEVAKEDINMLEKEKKRVERKLTELRAEQDPEVC